MDDCTLLPDEVVVTRNDDVIYGNKTLFGNGSKGSLILTSKRLVLLKKGMLGKIKDVSSFALSDIIISNGQPQVQAQKRPFNPSMDVYFRNGEEHFRFTWPDEAAEFAAAVITTITGQEVKAVSSDERFMEGAVAAMEKINHLANRIRRTFGLESTETMSATCPGCGASLTGTDGETVKCPYCGSYHTF